MHKIRTENHHHVPTLYVNWTPKFTYWLIRWIKKNEAISSNEADRVFRN